MMKVRNEIVMMYSAKKNKMIMLTHENDIIKKNLRTESSARLDLKSAIGGMQGTSTLSYFPNKYEILISTM